MMICLGLFCELGCMRSEMTNAQVAEMFDKAGGVDKVNEEAKIIFERLGTNESKEIFGSDLTNFPVISSLGKPFFLQNKNNPPAGQHTLKYLSALITKEISFSFLILAAQSSFRTHQDACESQPIFLSGGEL